MAEKTTTLSIVIATVDKATAGIKAINAQLDKVTKPVNNFKKALGDLAEKSGFNDVMSGFKGIGGAIEGLLSKVAMVGGVAGLAVAGLVHLVGEFDELGKKATRLGVSVDFLAEMRYAAEKTGVPVEALDDGLQAFNSSLGQARAGTGRMAKFLGLVSPVLLKQVKAAKDNAAAFDLIAGAMAKIEDPAKRAALAQKVFGDSALAPLFAKGPKGIKELRDRYLELAGTQEFATSAAEDAGDAMHDLHASADGVKAALVQGLSPALTVIVQQLTEWLRGHRDDIRLWATEIGEKLPGAIHSVVDAISSAVKWVLSFVDSVGGARTVAIAMAAILAGPLLSAVISFGIALLTTPFGLFLVGIAAIVAAVAAAVKAVEKLAAAGRAIGERLAFSKLVRQHADEIRELNQEAIDAGEITEEQVQAQARSLAANDIATSHAREDADFDKAMNASNPPTQATTPDVSNAARDAVVGKIASVTQSFIDALSSPAAAQKAKITIDISGAPKGTRVNTDPSSTADVDLGVGYQFAGAM